MQSKNFDIVQQKCKNFYKNKSLEEEYLHECRAILIIQSKCDYIKLLIFALVHRDVEVAPKAIVLHKCVDDIYFLLFLK